MLEVLLQAHGNPDAPNLYGLKISLLADQLPGTTYPILKRLVDNGWLTTRWEELDPREAARPRRCYCQLTTDGVENARKALQEAEARTGVRSAALARAAGVAPGLASPS
ncbi:MAG: PadR family transcriptional regulator [Pseudonocardiaceae bacterium]